MLPEAAGGPEGQFDVASGAPAEESTEDEAIEGYNRLRGEVPRGRSQIADGAQCPSETRSVDLDLKKAPKTFKVSLRVI